MYGNDVPTISNVSASFIASVAGSVPKIPNMPILYGLSSSTTALPKSDFTIGAFSFSAIASIEKLALDQ